MAGRGDCTRLCVPQAGEIDDECLVDGSLNDYLMNQLDTRGCGQDVYARVYGFIERF